jgi:hypothetical protein
LYWCFKVKEPKYIFLSILGIIFNVTTKCDGRDANTCNASCNGRGNNEPMVRGIEFGQSINAVVRFGMGNGFQCFGNRISNYSNIANEQLFNYSNIAIDIRVYILAVQHLYFLIWCTSNWCFYMLYYFFLKLFSILDCFNLSSVDNWTTK